MSAGNVTFGGVLRSEWIKLRSLRSTFWCAAIIFVLTVGLAALTSALILTANGSEPARFPTTAVMANALQTVTLSANFTALVAAVLGALMITGEFGTGMIRSTFAAVPRRWPALIGKAVIVTVSMFVIAAVSVVVAALVSDGILSARGFPLDLGDGGYWLALLGDAGYLALIGLLSLAIGAIIRNSAGGIATSIGLILVLPIVANLFAVLAKADWARNIGAFLPSDAGGRMAGYLPHGATAPPVPDGQLLLEPWQGLLVLLAWIVVLGVVATVLVRRRDV